MFGNICTIFTSMLHEVAMERWKGTFKCCNLASPCKIKYVHNVYILNTAKYGYFKFRMYQNSSTCTV